MSGLGDTCGSQSRDLSTLEKRRGLALVCVQEDIKGTQHEVDARILRGVGGELEMSVIISFQGSQSRQCKSVHASWCLPLGAETSVLYRASS